MEVSGATVRRGDRIVVGGVPMTVQNLHALPGKAKRVEFAEGPILTLPPSATLTVLRVAEGW